MLGKGEKGKGNRTPINRLHLIHRKRSPFSSRRRLKNKQYYKYGDNKTEQKFKEYWESVRERGKGKGE